MTAWRGTRWLTGRRRPSWLRWPYSRVGTAAAAVFFCLSVSPSLLPRSGLTQGVISGIVATLGYGLGVLLTWIVTTLRGRPWRPAVPPWVLGLLTVVGVLLVGVFLVMGSSWQSGIHRLMGQDPPERYGYIWVLALAAGVFVLLVGFARLLRLAAGSLSGFAGRWIPAPAARMVGGGVVAVLVIASYNQVVLGAALSAADTSFKAINSEIAPDSIAPVRTTRSGGPGSLVSWASLGKKGRQFVTGGPSQRELEAFNGTAPMEPIRVYAGIEHAETAAERAAAAVAELERTDAFSREVLVVITTTGTGWVDPYGVDPLEYLYNGDTAMVGTQYSYLPSWLSFLVDKARAREAGRSLFDEVYRVWSQRPEGSRPQLLVFGESLGSFGAESAFSGSDDMRNRTDGVLFLGPPSSNVLWSEFTEDRDAGTPEIEPSYRGGRTVRFANDASRLTSDADGWGTPRVVYLQHASDPITWWSPDLLLNRPDWLSEDRGEDVLPEMQWYPLVTFWQVTADMAFSMSAPEGHGHNYGTESVAAWVAITSPPGWTEDRTAALQDLLSPPG